MTKHYIDVQENRNYSVDLLKTICITGVVYIHGATLFCNSTVNIMIFKHIFRICVPIFLILFSYYFEIQFKNNAYNIKYLKKRFFQLLYIYISWSLIYFFILADFKKLNVKNFLTQHFTGFGWSGQYYFILLFQIILLYPLIRKIFNSKIKNYILMIYLITYFYLFFNYKVPDLISKMGDTFIFYFIPYIFVGFKMANSKSIKNLKFYYLIIFVSIIIEFFYLNYYKIKHDEYVTPSVLMCSIIFFMIFFNNTLFLKFRPFEKFIHLIGSKTMIIFVTNPIVIIAYKVFLPSAFFTFILQYNCFFISILSTLFIIINCLLIKEVINFLRLKNFLG
jgi:surface polysaccharide O-acyltransferase-like enzyme